MGNSLSVPGEQTVRTAAGQSVSELGFFSPLASKCSRLHVSVLNLCSEGFTFCDFQRPMKTSAVCLYLTHPVITLGSGGYRGYTESITLFFFSHWHDSIHLKEIHVSNHLCRNCSFINVFGNNVIWDIINLKIFLKVSQYCNLIQIMLFKSSLHLF